MLLLRAADSAWLSLPITPHIWRASFWWFVSCFLERLELQRVSFQQIYWPSRRDIWAKPIGRSNRTRLRLRWGTQTQRTQDVIITSLWRQNDVATSFWRNNDVVIASCARWGYMCEPTTCELRLVVRVHFLSLVQNNLRLYSSNDRPGYFSDWPSPAWVYCLLQARDRKRALVMWAIMKKLVIF